MISAWILTGVGYLVLILVIAVFVWACLRKNRDSYDERQKLARGTAARAGFFAIMAYEMCYAVTLGLEFYWCDAVTGVIIGPWLGISVFLVAAIWKDAYVRLYERAGVLRVALIFVLLVNGADLAMTVRDAALIRDGMLTGAVNSLMTVATDLAMLIALSVRIARGRREEKEAA